MKQFKFLLVIMLLWLFQDLNAQWNPTGLTTNTVWSLATTGSNLFAGTYSNGVFLSTNSGTTWSQMNTGLTDTTIWSLIAGAGNVLAGTRQAGVFRSTNQGSSWNPSNVGLPATCILTFAKILDTIFTGTPENGVFSSTNGGNSWSARNTGIESETIRNLAVNGRILYGATVGGVWRSTDAGTNWSYQRITPTPSFNPVEAVISFQNYLFAGTEFDGGFLSTDSGTTWSRADTGLTSSGIYSFVSINGVLLAGTNGGVFRSSDNGLSWSAFNSGLPATGVLSFAITSSDVFIGTSHMGVWHRPLSQFVTEVMENDPTLPTHFALRQNYPNPFNPRTKISYQLPMLDLVILKVFDLLGREVTTLVNGVEEPGYKSVQFDANRLSSGIYFYRLQAGDYIETKKLLLLR